jgi:hypothetical protein
MASPRAVFAAFGEVRLVRQPGGSASWCSSDSLAGRLEHLRRGALGTAAPGKVRAGSEARPVPVARQMLLQVAVRDIGQLT